jgi:hypothetical protein
MVNPPRRIPGRPRSPTPPGSLVEEIRRISHPDVVSAGLTTTADGEWAALVRVSRKAQTPIPEVERFLAGFPVVYERAPEFPPIARPAYPDRGE